MIISNWNCVRVSHQLCLYMWIYTYSCISHILIICICIHECFHTFMNMHVQQYCDILLHSHRYHRTFYWYRVVICRNMYFMTIPINVQPSLFDWYPLTIGWQLQGCHLPIRPTGQPILCRKLIIFRSSSTDSETLNQDRVNASVSENIRMKSWAEYNYSNTSIDYYLEEKGKKYKK